jgi:hypothetical protein
VFTVPREMSRLAGPGDAPAYRNRAAMTEHANEVIADDNAGTLLAIESTKQLKAQYVTAAEWEQMGQRGMNTFQKRLLPLAFGMLMYEGDPAVMRRTLSYVPRPARLLMPIIAPRAFSRHARRVYGTATPPKITA